MMIDHKPTIIGKTITLRAIKESDAQSMFDSLSDEEAKRLTGTKQSFSFEEVLNHCKRVFAANDRVDYAIILKETGDYVGEVVLNEIDWDNQSANMRIALAGKNWFGKGMGTEAIQLILDFGFNALNLHRIELEVYEFNPRAIRVYEKVGFKREGIRRDALFWDGKFYDAILMSILKSEFLTQ